jgi:hypothetical protein
MRSAWRRGQEVFGLERTRQRLLLRALDGVLDQVEDLIVFDIPDVPPILEGRIRRVVDAVDARLGYDVDQFGSSPQKAQAIIYTAQTLVMKGDQRSESLGATGFP